MVGLIGERQKMEHDSTNQQKLAQQLKRLTLALDSEQKERLEALALLKEIRQMHCTSDEPTRAMLGASDFFKQVGRELQQALQYTVNLSGILLEQPEEISGRQKLKDIASNMNIALLDLDRLLEEQKKPMAQPLNTYKYSALVLCQDEQFLAVTEAFLGKWDIRSDCITSPKFALAKFQEGEINKDKYALFIIDDKFMDFLREYKQENLFAEMLTVVFCDDVSMVSTEGFPENVKFLQKPVGQSAIFNSLVSSIAVEHDYKQCAKDESKVDAIILVVEDHEVNQRLIREYLQRLGYQVQVVNNGQEAIDELENKNYDLIFMDCQMPVLDGYEATKRIRKMEENTDNRNKIIALTAHAMQGDRELCLECGMDDYLAKPFRKKDLMGMLNKWL